MEEERSQRKSARPESLTRQRRLEDGEEKKTARPHLETGSTRSTGKKKTTIKAKTLSKQRAPLKASDLIPEDPELGGISLEELEELEQLEEEEALLEREASQRVRSSKERGAVKGKVSLEEEPLDKKRGLKDTKALKDSKDSKSVKRSAGSTHPAGVAGSKSTRAVREPRDTKALIKTKAFKGTGEGEMESSGSSAGAVGGKGKGRGTSLAGKASRALHFFRSIHWKQPAFLRMPAVPGLSQEETRRKIYLSVGGVFCILFVLILGLVLGRGTGETKASVPLQARQDQGGEKNTEALEMEASPEGGALVQREPVSFTASFVGDCTLGTDEYFDWDSSLNNYYDMYGADYFLENVRDIFLADDLTVANMEGALTYEEYREDKTFAFRGEPEYCQILTGSGVECANTANNHTHDYGEQGYLDTLEAMRSYSLTPFGYDEVCTIDVKGVKVGLSGIYILDDPEGSVTLLRQNMQKLKDAGSEVIICIFHWGIELDEAPDEDQRTLGRLAIDLGADLVCGHHPHVLQGIEEYKGRNIVYSLGNFCFGGNTYPTEFECAIFQQTFTVTSEGVAMDNVTKVIPCLVSSTHDYNDYRPTPQTDEEGERILELIDYRSSLIEPAVQTTI